MNIVRRVTRGDRIQILRCQQPYCNLKATVLQRSGVRHLAAAIRLLFLRMIFSENRYTLFRIMRL
jgi:hypothetical protein